MIFTINPGIIFSILIKEIQDIKKNTNILVMYILPIFLTLVWKNFLPEMPVSMALGFGLLFLVVMVGMYVPSMLIAEEKEKDTLEVLMLSPAGAGDVLLGKGLLTFISIILVSIILIFITGMGAQNFGAVLLSTILISIFSIFIGMMVGLLAPNQMATGTIGLPVYLLLLLVPQLASVNGQSGILNLLAGFLPTNYYFRILEMSLNQGLLLRDMLTEIGIIVLSILLTFLMLIYVYKRKGLS